MTKVAPGDQMPRIVYLISYLHTAAKTLWLLLTTSSDPSITVTTQSYIHQRITSPMLTPSSPRTLAARLAYSIAAAVVYVARPDIASDGALPLLKIVSPSSTPNSERTILAVSCSEHKNYACINHVSAFSPQPPGYLALRLRESLCPLL